MRKFLRFNLIPFLLYIYYLYYIYFLNYLIISLNVSRISKKEGNGYAICLLKVLFLYVYSLKYKFICHYTILVFNFIIFIKILYFFLTLKNPLFYYLVKAEKGIVMEIPKEY